MTAAGIAWAVLAYVCAAGVFLTVWSTLPPSRDDFEA